MSDAAVLSPPVAPDRASLVGRLLMGYVPNAGSAGALGAGIGGLVGSLPGAAVGMTIGVVGAMLLTGNHYGIKDAVKWRQYQQQRHEYMAGSGEWAPDERRSSRRRLRMVAGTGVAVGLMAFTGIGVPALTAVPALAFYGSMMAGAYLLTRVALRRRGYGDDVANSGYGPGYGPDHGQPGRAFNQQWTPTMARENVSRDRRPMLPRKEMPLLARPASDYPHPQNRRG